MWYTSYWQWNCKNANLLFGVSKSLPSFYFIKGKETNTNAWNFHRVYFTWSKKIREVFKEWCWVFYHLGYELWQEVCSVANRDSRFCSVTNVINLCTLVLWSLLLWLKCYIVGNMRWKERFLFSFCGYYGFSWIFHQSNCTSI